MDCIVCFKVRYAEVAAFPEVDAIETMKVGERLLEGIDIFFSILPSSQF